MNPNLPDLPVGWHKPTKAELRGLMPIVKVVHLDSESQPYWATARLISTDPVTVQLGNKSVMEVYKLESLGIALFEAIVPGTFVRVRVPFGEQTDALLVTERALGADQSGRFLLVVNDENVVEQRSVTLGALYDGKRAILSGIDRDDWVIVNGLQRARPGAAVDPQREGESGTRTAASDSGR